MKKYESIFAAIAAVIILFSSMLDAKFSVLIASLAFIAFSAVLCWRDRTEFNSSKEKIVITAIVAFLIAGGLVANLRYFSGEDDWICQDGKWVKHGQPSAPMPNASCPGGDPAQLDQVNSSENAEAQDTNAQLANPAAVNCGQKGGQSEIITNPDGSQAGECKFSDGRVCDEWDFFRTGACGQENMISWANAVDLIKNCEVDTIVQTQALNVTLQLKDGSRIETIEPKIDEAVTAADGAEDKCGKIKIMTE